MPRLMLTEDEAKIITARREREMLDKVQWNAAIEAMRNWVQSQRDWPGPATTNGWIDLVDSHLQELRK